MTRLCVNFDLPFCDYRDKEGTESNFDGKASQSQENSIPEGETAELEEHNSENMQDGEEQMQGDTVHFEASEATQPKDPEFQTSFPALHGTSAEQSEEEENCMAVENEGQSFRSGDESQMSEFEINLPEKLDSAQRSEHEKSTSIDELTNGQESEMSLATASNSQRHVIEASSPEGLCSSHGISETGSSKTQSTQSQNSGDGRDVPHSEWVDCERSLKQNQPQIPALKLTLMPSYKSSSSGQESQADSYASETDQQHSPTMGSTAEIKTQYIPEQESKMNLQLDQDSHSQHSNSQEGNCKSIETVLVENIEQQNTDMLSSHRLSEDSGDSDSSSCKSDPADASVEISLCRSLPHVDTLTDNKDKEDVQTMNGLSEEEPNEDTRHKKVNEECAEQSRQSSSPPSSPISGKSSSLNLNSLT